MCFLMNKWRRIFFILLIIFSGLNIYAQNNLSKPLIFKTEKEIEIKDDYVFTVIMQFENTTNDTINAQLKLKLPSAIKSYSQDYLTIKINPNKKAFIPLKFSVNKVQTAGKIPLNLTIIDLKTQQELANSTTQVSILSKRELKVFPVQPNLFYRQEGDSVHYELRVINSGNQKARIFINNVLPDFRGNFTTENRKVDIDAFKEKIVRFSKFVSRDMIKVEQFQANVSAYTANDEFVGNVFFNIQNASSNRSFVDPTNFNQSWIQQSSNYVRVTMRDVGAQNENLNFMAHQEFSVGLNEFAYNINGSSWKNNQDMLLTDSWLKYQRNGKGLLLGTINSNDFDMPINGRGVMFFNNFDKTDKKIIVGAAERNYNLLDNFNPNQYKNNYTAFANTRFLVREDNELESTVLYDRNVSVSNFILTNDYRWTSKNRWNHSVRFGYGFSKLNQTNRFENSLSLAANVSGSVGKYDIYSTNYFSSGYYPGVRSGALYLNQRIQRVFKKFSLWTAFTLTNNNPKSVDNNLTYYTNSNQSKALRAEVGTSFRIGNQFNLSISPKLNVEQGNVFNVNSFSYSPIHFKSSYLNGSFSWLSNSRNHQLVLNTYAGGYTFDERSDINLLLFGQLTWSYRFLQLNTSYQKGSLMIAEVYSRNNINNHLERYNAALSLRKDFFHKRLNTLLSGYYNFDRNFGNTFTFGGTIEYQPFDNFTINTQINYNKFHSNFFTNDQSYYQVGVQYNLPAKKTVTDIKNGNLDLFIYYDYNANGVFDAGDQIADNRVVKINETTFITDLDGKIKYKKVPYGDYVINLPGEKWFSQDYAIHLNNKTMSLAIPMQQTGIVRGRIVYELTSNLEYQVSASMSGFTLVFTSDNGQIFNVRTNDRGEYTAFLPVGNYSFSILEKSLPEHVYAKIFSNKVTVHQEDNIDYEPLVLKIKERKVNIKRFGN